MAAPQTTTRDRRLRKGRVNLSLEAPDAKAVLVTGSFCDWETGAWPLKFGRRGIWKTALDLPPGRYEYRFLIDGIWCDDPNCTERVPNPFGSQNCVLHVP